MINLHTQEKTRQKIVTLNDIVLLQQTVQIYKVVLSMKVGLFVMQLNLVAFFVILFIYKQHVMWYFVYTKNNAIQGECFMDIFSLDLGNKQTKLMIYCVKNYNKQLMTCQKLRKIYRSKKIIQLCIHGFNQYRI